MPPQLKLITKKITRRLITRAIKQKINPKTIFCLDIDECHFPKIKDKFPLANIKFLTTKELLTQTGISETGSVDFMIANFCEETKASLFDAIRECNRLVSLSGLFVFATYDEKSESILENEALIYDEDVLEILENLRTFSVAILKTRVHEDEFAAMIYVDLFTANRSKKMILLEKEIENESEEEGEEDIVTSVEEDEGEEAEEKEEGEEEEEQEEDEEEAEESEEPEESEEAEEKEAPESEEAEEPEEREEAEEKEEAPESEAEESEEPDEKEEPEEEPEKGEAAEAEEAEEEEDEEDEEEEEEGENDEEHEEHEAHVEHEEHEPHEKHEAHQDHASHEDHTEHQTHEAHDAHKDHEEHEEHEEHASPHEEDPAAEPAKQSQDLNQIKQDMQKTHDSLAVHQQSCTSILEKLNNIDMTRDEKNAMVDKLKYHMNQQQEAIKQSSALRNKFNTQLGSFINSHSAELMKKEDHAASYQNAIEEHKSFLEKHDENIAKHSEFIDSLKPNLEE